MHVISYVIMLVVFSGTVVRGRWSGGDSSSNSRVYNGDFAVPSQFPYFANIRMSNGDICGGSLISESSVLTAAHCLQIKDSAGNIKDLTPLLQEVLIGCTTLDEPRGTRNCQERFVSSVHIHPSWGGYVSKGSTDVAILSLNRPVTNISPVKIASSAKPGEVAEVVGFGQSGSSTSGSVLTYAEQKVKYIDGLYLVTVPDTSGPCYGDSGGPLVTRKGLVGIVSYGTGLCDSLDDTDGYFYVPRVQDWINIYINSPEENVSSDKPSPPDYPSTSQLKNGVYTLQVVSGSCKRKYLASSIKPSCSDSKLRLYSSSFVRKKSKKTNSYIFKSPSLWKIVTKPSDQTVYLQSVPRDACVNTFVQSTKSQTTILGPINEGWVMENVSPQSNYVHLLSTKSYQYLSAGKNCKPSSKARNRTRLKFQIREFKN